MKKGLLITSAFALLFGVGVAVGAQQQKTERASAATQTLYFDVSSCTWWNDASAKTYVYFYNNSENNGWIGEEMTKVSTYKYSTSVDTKYTSVIFLRVNPSDLSESGIWNRTNKNGGTAINLPTDYSVKNQFNLTADGSNYDDGNYCGNWSLYTPTSYTVSVHLDNKGVKTTTNQTVAKDDLPTVDYVFGESFSGWFDDENYTEGHEVTAITSNTTVYGKITAIPTATYTVQVEEGAEFGNSLKLYAFEPSGKENAGWPGEAISDNSITVPTDAKLIINNGTKQTVNISQPTNPVANEKLVVSAETVSEGTDAGKYKAYWELDEVVSEEGYYLVGSKTNYKFRGATYIEKQAADTSFNVGLLLGYTAADGEEVTIRSYLNSAYDWVANGDPTEGSVDPVQHAYGYRSGSNFHFTTAGSYDIFVHEDSFYVAPHAARHYVNISNVLFAGSQKGESVARPKTLATEGGNFNPGEFIVSGYVQRGYFTDEDCTVAYVPAEVKTDDVQLYCKYTKVGYYYAIAAVEFNIDDATLMNSEGLTGNNKAEAGITVAAVNTIYSFKHYTAESTTDSAGLGAEYPYAEKSSTVNVKFTKIGSYTVYWNNEDKLYLNAGLEAFYSNFLLEIGNTCSADGNTDPEALQAAWALQKSAFSALDADDKALFAAAKADKDSDKQSEKVAAMYDYIVKKYGDTAFEDFADRFDGPVAPGTKLAEVQNNSGNSYVAVIIIAATISAIAVGTFLLLKKKHN